MLALSGILPLNVGKSTVVLGANKTRTHDPLFFLPLVSVCPVFLYVSICPTNICECFYSLQPLSYLLGTYQSFQW